ncbi:hypothetical protein R6Q59_026431 [Mikania micrantha]
MAYCKRRTDATVVQRDNTMKASWLIGSYVNTAPEPLRGELAIHLSNDVQLKLHMSKNAERPICGARI